MKNNLFCLIALSFFTTKALCLLPTDISQIIEGRKGYVVGEPYKEGRLGNQMFHIASVLGYAWDHDFKPVFSGFDVTESNFKFNRDKVFFRLDFDTTDIEIDYFFIKLPTDALYSPIPQYSNEYNVFLKGHFIGWKHFHHHYDNILKTFLPSTEITNYLNEKYRDLLTEKNTVAVHVRTYSEKLHHLGFYFLGINFFKSAFELFPQDSIFVIFSDRINWCKKKFTECFPNRNLVFVEGNSDIEDFFLMSTMHHQVLSYGSTYSWWAAYLNHNPDSIIVHPKNGFWGLSDETYYLPNWHPIDFIIEPYPEDMSSYDKETHDDIVYNNEIKRH